VGEIEEHLARCDVFIVLWSRDYACSPWCYDELATALRRAEAGEMQLWLLRVDDIRIVPPKARELIAYDCFDRDRLASTLAVLSDRLA
jgi:TIR domain